MPFKCRLGCSQSIDKDAFQKNNRRRGRMPFRVFSIDKDAFQKKHNRRRGGLSAPRRNQGPQTHKDTSVYQKRAARMIVPFCLVSLNRMFVATMQRVRFVSTYSFLVLRAVIGPKHHAAASCGAIATAPLARRVPVPLIRYVQLQGQLLLSK